MSVYGLLSAAKGFVKIRNVEDKEVIDVTCSRKHYRWTAGVLILCCLISTATSLIGNPITCLVGDGLRGSEGVINTFCWITSTFTLPRHYDKPIGTHVPAHGIGPYVYGEDEAVYHTYYQWVPFVLFFEGLLFYLPHWIWKNWEKGTIKSLTDGLRGAYVEKTEEKTRKIKLLAKYLVKAMYCQEKYAFGFLMSEILNIVNVFLNIWLLNKFLGGVFLNYGLAVLSYTFQDQDVRTDPMITLFPRQTKCTFYKYGSSGSIERHDALCILSLNIMNEKIFVFLWFWLILLCFITMISFLYSAAIFMYKRMRKGIMERKYKKKLTPELMNLISEMPIGAFILLYLLSQNLNEIIFKDLINYMSLLRYYGDEIPPPFVEEEMGMLNPTADSPDGSSEQSGPQETATSPSNVLPQNTGSPENIHQTDTLPVMKVPDLMASFQKQNAPERNAGNMKDEKNAHEMVTLPVSKIPDLMFDSDKQLSIAIPPPPSLFTGLNTSSMQDTKARKDKQASEMDLPKSKKPLDLTVDPQKQQESTMASPFGTQELGTPNVANLENANAQELTTPSLQVAFPPGSGNVSFLHKSGVKDTSI